MTERKGKRWTQEEIDILQDSWGAISLTGIANRLGRTATAVRIKSQKIGLGDPLKHIDGITINQLSEVLNVHYGNLKNWINKYGLPAKQKRLAESQQVWIIAYDDFWKWAEKNKQMLDFARMERLSIGPEPDWVDVKRKADKIKLQHKPQPHNTPWSEADDKKLIWMLDQHKYTYPEIAEEIKRSQGAIKRRMLDLGLKARPVRLRNHNKYSDEEVEKIIKMMNKGFCFEEIASRLGENRSALGVRGKVERMGYRFKNGVPYLAKEGETDGQETRVWKRREIQTCCHNQEG